MLEDLEYIEMMFSNEDVILLFLRCRRELLMELARCIGCRIPKSDETRKTICDFGDPIVAYSYALHIDKGPHLDTRLLASKNSFYAYFYAVNIDECPHEVTRKGVIDNPWDAFSYARHVDQRPSPEMLKAVSSDKTVKRKYEAYFYNFDNWGVEYFEKKAY